VMNLGFCRLAVGARAARMSSRDQHSRRFFKRAEERKLRMTEFSSEEDINSETTKKFARLLSAVGALGEDLHGQGIINLEKVRLTISARREEAKRLIKAGKSQREAAEELGVSRGQIAKDLNGECLASKVAKNGSKGSATQAINLNSYLPPVRARQISPSEESLNIIIRIISEWSEIKTVIERNIR
jgi:predicted DNA-binding protein (UPF0251 family)